MFDYEPFPTPTHDFAPGLTSAPDTSALPETPSARAAAVRRAEADRKREERAQRKKDGIPDPRTVDAAIINAIVSASIRRGHPRTIAKTKSLGGLAISLQDIVGGAMQELVEVKGIGQAQAKGALIVRLGLGR